MPGYPSEVTLYILRSNCTKFGAFVCSVPISSKITTKQLDYLSYTHASVKASTLAACKQYLHSFRKSINTYRTPPDINKYSIIFLKSHPSPKMIRGIEDLLVAGR